MQIKCSEGLYRIVVRDSLYLHYNGDVSLRLTNKDGVYTALYETRKDAQKIIDKYYPSISKLKDIKVGQKFRFKRKDIYDIIYQKLDGMFIPMREHIVNPTFVKRHEPSKGKEYLIEWLCCDYWEEEVEIVE